MKLSYQQLVSAAWSIALIGGCAIVMLATPLCARAHSRTTAHTSYQVATALPTTASGTATASVDIPTVAPADENAGTIIAPTIAAPALTPAPIAPGATAAPLPPSNTSSQSSALPDTAATAPALQIGLMLCGIALVLHATRRVRHADAELRAKSAIERLAPFAHTALRQHNQTRATLDQARALLNLAHGEPPATNNE